MSRKRKKKTSRDFWTVASLITATLWTLLNAIEKLIEIIEKLLK